MLRRCASRFEIEQGEIDLTKEYISTGEAAAIDQEKASVQPLRDLDQYEPINDEEEEEEEEDENELPATQLDIQATRARKKRPRSSTCESIDYT
jgi:hypothetical protein